MNKIVYVFDLDFTLIKSDAKIYVYRNGAFYRALNSRQYNSFVKQKGDVLDFREFKDGDFILNAQHYKMWPLLKKLNHLVTNKKISADIYILTARSAEVKADIYALFKEDGIIIDMKHIITLGDDRGDLNVSEEKKKVLEVLSKRYSKILFFDDDIKNIQIANKINRVQTKLVESTLDEAIKYLPGRTQEEIRDTILSMPNSLEKIYAAKKMNVELSEKEIKMIKEKEIQKILNSNHRFSAKIYEIKRLGDLTEKQKSEIIEDLSPTDKLEAAYIFKDKELAEEALEDNAGAGEMSIDSLITFFVNKGIKVDKFIKNNANNPKNIAFIYTHYFNNSAYKPILQKIINSFNANKLFRFATSINPGSWDGNQWTINKEIDLKMKHYIEQSIKKGATTIGHNHNKLFQDACDHNNLELVKLLLKSPYVDPSDTTKDGIHRNEHNWAIRRAASKGYIEIVKLLLKDKRVNPAERNNFALKWAAKNEHKDVVRLLLKDKRVLQSLNKEDMIKIFKLTK